MLSRRTVLEGLSSAVGCAILPGGAQATKSSAPFRVLHARPAVMPAAHGERTPGSLLAYEGQNPGPVLRIRQGEELNLRLFNELAEPTSVHWHGVRLPNAMDGAPNVTQLPIEPGTSFDYRFRPPDAGTFWYHAHSADQADRGLHGALIVEEAAPVDVDRDLVIVLGMPAKAATLPQGSFLVNGAGRPDIPVNPGEQLRVRFINATSARGASLKLEGHDPWVMAIDGQPTDPFRPREARIGLAPGARVDVFIDATASAGASVPLLAGASPREEHVIAHLVYQAGGGAPPANRRRSLGSASPPPPLPSNPLPARIDLKTALVADMTVADAADAGRAVVGEGRPLFSVRRGRAVNLGLHHSSAEPRVVHIHGHHFRLLDRLDDGWKPYWLDTLVISEATERVAFVAGNPGRWLIEHRALESKGVGSAAWFVVS
jgi:FtsP/CotA-like multicopper oxidase with cupredoxin domain